MRIGDWSACEGVMVLDNRVVRGLFIFQQSAIIMVLTRAESFERKGVFV